MIIGHGGNIYDAATQLGCDPSDIIDMSSNLNPLGPPDGLSRHLTEKMDAIISLPEVDSKHITSLVAERYGLPAECVLAGNGTTQFIYSIPRALNTKKALIVGPSYADYKDACAMNHAAYEFFLARPDDDFVPDTKALLKAVKGKDTVFICNPNNPTGVLWDHGKLEELCRSFPETFFVIDESYLPFAADHYTKSAVRFKLRNVIVLNSMSKIFRIPGLRVGFLLAPVTLIYRFETFVLPWSVNALAQEAVRFLVENRDGVQHFLEKSRAFVEDEKRLFLNSLEQVKAMTVFPGAVYFVLARLNGPVKAKELCRQLLQHRFLIRNCGNFEGLDDRYVRFSLKDREANKTLARHIREILG